jgi:flagellar protein FlaG
MIKEVNIVNMDVSNNVSAMQNNVSVIQNRATQQMSASTTQARQSYERVADNPKAPEVARPHITSEERGTMTRPQESSLSREENVTDRMIEQAIEDANKVLAPNSFRLSYNIHEATNRVMVRVYDTDTNEIVREVPTESRLDILAKIVELTGLMFDGHS